MTDEPTLQPTELDGIRDSIAALRADLDETVHDLIGVVRLLDTQLGEPFRSQATEIITKRQTGGEGSR